MTAEARLEKLRRLMRSHGIDIVALIPGANMRYLTGAEHYVMERPIVLFIPQDGQPTAVIPRLEVPLFARHPLPAQIVSWTDSEGYGQTFKAGLDMLHPAGKLIGVEGLRMRFFEGEIIRQYAAGAEVRAIDDVLAPLRLIKDDDEIALMRKAIRLSEQALEMTLGGVRVDLSEREVAHQLETHLKDLGCEELAFKTIVHGGGNSALPHSGPLDYGLRLGDPLIFDFGGTVEGYCADITRVVFVGEPGQDFRDFYAVVQAANAAGRSAARPGVTAESVDLAARQVFIAAGYESLIRHRTGHGLGLESHEAPYIVAGNQQLLQPGMVFTVEPGIYKMEQIGVRIEDDVLVTDSGVESLTTFPRDLRIVGP
jgi:Xaa-Pro aminopeptidase